MRFILTAELGRLAKWLRILGFDALYYAQADFPALLIQALRDERIILTRNQRLIDKLRAARAVQIRSEKISEQLKEVLQRLGIKPQPDKMFSRCIICNRQLCSVKKQQVKGKVPEFVFKTQDEFFSCPCCQRVYWPGTHWGNVKNTLKEICSL